MAFEKLTSSISDLKDNIEAFKNSSAEYYKLDLYKKIVKASTSIITIVLLSFLGLFLLLFLSIAVAVSISTALGVPSAGYFIVAGFYFILIILLATVGKKYITKTILIKSSRKFFND